MAGYDQVVFHNSSFVKCFKFLGRGNFDVSMLSTRCRIQPLMHQCEKFMRKESEVLLIDALSMALKQPNALIQHLISVAFKLVWHGIENGFCEFSCSTKCHHVTPSLSCHSVMAREFMCPSRWWIVWPQSMFESDPMSTSFKFSFASEIIELIVHRTRRNTPQTSWTMLNCHLLLYVVHHYGHIEQHMMLH